MGTGKDLVARALHALSDRSKGPLIAVNCAAMPDTLIESELFGHERGAFSGAVAQKKGKIEIANGGTLFLDELGEMKLESQAKLLRVIQNREFERLGGTQTIHVDVRIIAATNRDLEAAVSQGLFRGDLYYRLAVITLRTPSLRQMREDIPLLADHLLNQCRYLRPGRPVRGFSEEALQFMMQYDWPGNVRHLQSAIEQALVLGENEFIEPEDLPEAVLAKKPGKSSARGFESRILEFKKQIVKEAMDEAGGNFIDAARSMDITANYLRKLYRNLDMA
jgi:transcriptional regulator with PAS, ATPase and Fis domain